MASRVTCPRGKALSWESRSLLDTSTAPAPDLVSVAKSLGGNLANQDVVTNVEGVT